MTDEGRKKHEGPRHEGPARTSPYPVQRLAPPIELVDVAREIAEADSLVRSRVGGQLEVIADQIRALQAEARRILDRARRDMELHRAECRFERRPGRVYHLYRRADGSTWFSMVSPEEWGTPPDTFVGSYRLEADRRWTPVEELDAGEEDARRLVDHLLSDPTIR